MGFRYDTSGRRNKNAPKGASVIGMILIFIAIGVSIAFGWWLPRQEYFYVRQYLTFTATWPDWQLSVFGGVVAFILLQFLIALISGILFPLPPKDELDQDGFIKRK